MKKLRKSTSEVHLGPSEAEAYLYFSYCSDAGRRYVLFVNKRDSIIEKKLSGITFFPLWKQVSGWLDNSQVT